MKKIVLSSAVLGAIFTMSVNAEHHTSKAPAKDPAAEARAACEAQGLKDKALEDCIKAKATPAAPSTPAASTTKK